MPKAKSSKKSSSVAAVGKPTEEDVPKDPTTGKPARGPGIIQAEHANKPKATEDKLPSGEPRPTLSKTDGPPETLEEEVAAGNASPAGKKKGERPTKAENQAASDIPTVKDIMGEAYVEKPVPEVPVEDEQKTLSADASTITNVATGETVELPEDLAKRLRRAEAEKQRAVEEDIAAKQAAMVADNPQPPGVPFVENDPLNAKAQADAQEADDAMFREGVIGAAVEDKAYVPPSEEEVRARVLSEVANDRTKHDRNLDAYVELDPNFKPGRNNAEHAAAKARVKENNF